MLRKAIFIIAFAGLACGSQETSQSTPGAGATGGTEGGAAEVEIETPPVSAIQPPSSTGPAPSAEAVSCLELVSGGKYAEAVVICQTAANQDPTNTDVATALAKAGAATAAQGAAGAASAAAGERSTTPRAPAKRRPPTSFGACGACSARRRIRTQRVWGSRDVTRSRWTGPRSRAGPSQ